jgi:kynurenine formamidase
VAFGGLAPCARPAARPAGRTQRRLAQPQCCVLGGANGDLNRQGTPVRVLDLSQDFSVHTPAFASYDGPSIKWVKRLAFEKAGGQMLTSSLHVGTHLDAPAHFQSGGKFIGDLPLDWLVGPACVVDLERMGIGDYEIYGPEHFERWERDTGLRTSLATS